MRTFIGTFTRADGTRYWLVREPKLLKVYKRLDDDRLEPARGLVWSKVIRFSFVGPDARTEILRIDASGDADSKVDLPPLPDVPDNNGFNHPLPPKVQLKPSGPLMATNLLLTFELPAQTESGEDEPSAFISKLYIPNLFAQHIIAEKFHVHRLPERLPQPGGKILFEGKKTDDPPISQIFAGLAGADWKGEMRLGAIQAIVDGKPAPVSLWISREMKFGSAGGRLPLVDGTSVGARCGGGPLVLRGDQGESIRWVQMQAPEWPDKLDLWDRPFWLLSAEIPDRLIARSWRSDIVEPYLASLQTMRGDRPVSAVPCWSGKDDKKWSATFGVFSDSSSKNGFGLGGSVWLGMDSLLNQLSDQQPEIREYDCEFPGLRRHDGDFLQRTVKWGYKPPGAAKLCEWVRTSTSWQTLQFSLLEAEASVAQKPQNVRFGAFDLTFERSGDSASSEDDRKRANLTPSGCAASRNAQQIKVRFDRIQGGPSSEFSVRLDLDLKLALSDLTPGSQDDPEVEQVRRGVTTRDVGAGRQRPLLLPLRPNDAPQEASLVADIHEEAGDRRRQKLEITITSNGALPGYPVLVLDSEPFLVARVDVPKLESSAEGYAIAEFTSDSEEGSLWLVKAQQTGYQLMLPPQAVGESTVSLPSLPKKRIKGKTKKTSGQSDNTAEEFYESGEYADFRFSFPARLKVFTTFRGAARQSVEPPTNTRRIFGDASQRAPGAPLSQADFELLYGMGARVQRKDLLVTELTAEMGLLPPPLPDDLPPDWQGDGTGYCETYQGFRDVWDSIRLAFSRRLGVLSMRQAGRLTVQQGQADEPPKLSEGISFRLRDRAEIRRPVPMPADGVKVNSPYGPGGKREGLVGKNGLAGGADWGFASTEMYESVWGKPESDLGELADVYFSALGGWGYQRAVFNNRRTTLISRASMGRTHFYSLEMVGRIGAWWHRAKHVVIYERTTVRSEEFYTRDQPALSGRPVLRKVREYVEILQPERTYPDFGADRLPSAGIRSMRFRSTIIAVDSAWGEDIPGWGWRVPLWREGAGDPGPQGPQVDLELAADPDSGSRSCRAAFAKPQQLFFFANTREGFDDNTDAWPAVPGLDYVNWPLVKDTATPAQTGNDGDARLPSPAAVPPGFNAVTFDLLPLGETAANLMAERGYPAMGAVLQNVTIMRAAPARAPDDQRENADLAERVVQARGQFAHVIAEIRRTVSQLPSGNWDDNAKRFLQESVERLKEKNGLFGRADQALADLNAHWQALDPCKWLKNCSDRAVDEAKDRIKKEPSVARRRLIEHLRAIQNHAGANKDEFKRLVELWFVRLRSSAARVGNLLQGLQGPLTSAQTLDLKGIVDAELNRLKALAAETQIGARAQMLAAFSRTVEEIGSLLDAELDRAFAAIGERLPGAAKALGTQRGKVRATLLVTGDTSLRKLKEGEIDIDAAIDRLRTSLQEPLGRLSGAFESQAGTLQKKGVQDIAKLLDSISKSVTDQWTDLQGAIANAPSLPDVIELVDQTTAGVLQCVLDQLESVKQNTAKHICNMCQDLIGDSATLAPPDIRGVLDSIANTTHLEDALRALGDQAGAALDQIRASADRYLAEIGPQLNMQNPAEVALRMVRAFGQTPRVPGLDFNRRRIAYFFDQARALVDITPVTALVDRVGQDLKPFGIRLPSLALGDGLVPDLPSLKQLDIGQLFPDFAGFRLDGLFKGLKLPAINSEQIKVKHGFDREAGRAWLDARTEQVRLGAKTSLFDLGPVSLALDGGTVDAEARLEATLSGATGRAARGEIKGDWILGFGGQTLVAFRKTALSFDHTGRLSFDIDPHRVELQQPLEFVQELLNKVGNNVGGLKISLLKDGTPLFPVGVDSLLDLPLPPLTFGAFGVSGMRLTTGMALRAFDEFAVTTRFGLGSKTEPFTITVFILGGAGWVDTSARYTPLTGALSTDLSVAIGVSAYVGINLGVISGGAQIFLGINAELHTGSNQLARTTVKLVLLVRGSVVVIGILHASLELYLEASIERGTVNGRGTAKFTVKIGFWEQSVSERVDVRLGGGAAKELQKPICTVESWLETLV